jgi:hypothetical protein
MGAERGWHYIGRWLSLMCYVILSIWALSVSHYFQQYLKCVKICTKYLYALGFYDLSH